MLPVVCVLRPHIPVSSMLCTRVEVELRRRELHFRGILVEELGARRFEVALLGIRERKLNAMLAGSFCIRILQLAVLVAKGLVITSLANHSSPLDIDGTLAFVVLWSSHLLLILIFDFDVFVFGQDRKSGAHQHEQDKLHL